MDTPFANISLASMAIVSQQDTTSQTPQDITMEKLRSSFDTIVEDNIDKLTLRVFKREAIAAWRRKRPVRENSYQAFVKNNISNVRTNNPNAPHSEHMKIIGSLWTTSGKKRKTYNTNDGVTM